MTWLPIAIFTVLAVTNGDKPQICISLTWLLIIIDLQYLPLFDICTSVYDEQNTQQGPPLLTWINFKLSIDK